MGRTAIFNQKMNFTRIIRVPKSKKELSTLEVDESMIDIKNKLKKKVICIQETDTLTLDKIYKINAEFENAEFESGKCIIVINDQNDTKGYDSSIFMYIYDGNGLDSQIKEPIPVILPSVKVKSPVEFRGNTLRTGFSPQK